MMALKGEITEFGGAQLSGRASSGPFYISYDDMQSFETSMDGLELELRRFISQRVREEAVEDILQELRIAAWQSLPKYDGKSKFRTWVYGICVHKCHDYYRSRRHDERLVPIDSLNLVDDRPSLERTLGEVEAIRQVLGSLEDSHREVLELYYYAQLTLKEIATALNRNLNTVKSQFYRAHSILMADGAAEGLR